MSHFNTGTVWLITPRTKPAWEAALNLLDDDHWHPTSEVANVMRQASDLAPRTVENHLRSAGVRGWIHNRRKRTKLRDRQLIEDALEAVR